MICSNLGLCTGQFEQLPPPMVARNISFKSSHSDVKVEVETVRVGGPKVGGAYCTLCEVVVTSLDSSIQVTEEC